MSKHNALIPCSAFLLTIALGTPAGAQSEAETGSNDGGTVTYHGDALRTGWNRHELSLTNANVNAGSFGLVATIPLDDQVDAQPLVAVNQSITAGSQAGIYDVVYVVTENDSVYAINAKSGTPLLETTLGSPVPRAQLPGSCSNNGPNVGIASTPVIDRASNTLYLIADTFENGHAIYRIHALDLRTLVDKVPPVVVSATHALSNGTTYVFAADVERQRAALLESGGTVYAGFASYCDGAANQSRGLILGWRTGTLAPIASGDLTDSAGTSPESFFLSAVWMSGAGLASDASGSVFFSTGNSDAHSYDEGVHDIQESVVRVSADLTTLQSYFTPSNYATLDNEDDDLGSGGVLLVPYQQAASVHAIALTAGKDGRLFVLNRNALGGYSPTGNAVLETVAIGGCFCGTSYYVGSDGVPRILTSGGSQIVSWRLQTSPAINLVEESASPSLPGNQDPGLFTTVSSNDTTAGSALAWSVTRPANRDPADVDLVAIDPTVGTLLFSAVAGTWPNTGGNANIVPTVSGGRVFVASFQQLAIFGLLSPGAAPLAAARPRDARALRLAAGMHQYTGIVGVLTGSAFTLRTRTGRLVQIDASVAARRFASSKLHAGETVVVRGRSSGPWSLTAFSVQREKTSLAMWTPDR